MIALLTAAILVLSAHVEPDRARGIAADIASVSQEEPFFDGDAGPTATALLLVSIANVESRFEERIEQCRCRKRECDSGRSKGLWQIMRGDPSMCGDRKKQARAALSVLKEARRMCNGIGMALGAYNSGRCRETKASRYVLATWRRLAKDAGIVMRDGRADWQSRGDT